MSEVEPVSCNLPFNEPGIVHVAAEPGDFGGWYQECAICGYVLQDYTAAAFPLPIWPPPWAPGTRVSVNPGRPAFRYADGEFLHKGDALCSREDAIDDGTPKIRRFTAEKEKPVQSISYEELVQALKSVRIWMRHEPVDSTAFLMHVLQPEDAARDIFVRAMAVKDE